MGLPCTAWATISDRNRRRTPPLPAGRGQLTAEQCPERPVVAAGRESEGHVDEGVTADDVGSGDRRAERAAEVGIDDRGGAGVKLVGGHGTGAFRGPDILADPARPGAVAGGAYGIIES